MPSMLETREDPKLGLATEILRCRGTVHLKAWGTSMLPSVWPGDMLTIQGAAYDEVVPGDIVLVLRRNRFVVHRLVERRRGQDCLWWITKGDAMPHSDPPAAASELLGRVSGIRRANRNFVPSQRVSLSRRALAWMLCHWDRFRNLTLRIHAAHMQAGPTRSGQFFGCVFGAVQGISGIPRCHTSHQ
jgi:signal peptidase I